MQKQAYVAFAGRAALLASLAVLGWSSRAPADGLDAPGTRPRHFSGLLNDYTPSAALVKGGPYEMRGRWRLDVDWTQGTAEFAASMNMETSDYGIQQGTVNKDDPTTRGAHTHHIRVTKATVLGDTSWMSLCPKSSPAAKSGFVVTSDAAFVTGNGASAPFGNPSPVTICILGGDVVHFSNMSLAFGAPANTHFGHQAIHGVVSHCGDARPDSEECTVQDGGAP